MTRKKKKPAKSRIRKKSGSRKKRASKKKAVAAAAPPPAPEVVETPDEPEALDWDGKRVLAIRKRLGMTQEQFATKLGVAFVTVNRWENDKFTPRGLYLDALRKIEEGGLQSEPPLPRPNPFSRARSQSAHA